MALPLIAGLMRVGKTALQAATKMPGVSKIANGAGKIFNNLMFKNGIKKGLVTNAGVMAGTSLLGDGLQAMGGDNAAVTPSSLNQVAEGAGMVLAGGATAASGVITGATNATKGLLGWIGNPLRLVGTVVGSLASAAGQGLKTIGDNVRDISAGRPDASSFQERAQNYYYSHPLDRVAKHNDISSQLYNHSSAQNKTEQENQTESNDTAIDIDKYNAMINEYKNMDPSNPMYAKYGAAIKTLAIHIDNTVNSKSETSKNFDEATAKKADAQAEQNTTAVKTTEQEQDLQLES